MCQRLQRCQCVSAYRGVSVSAPTGRRHGYNHAESASNEEDVFPEEKMKDKTLEMV